MASTTDLQLWMHWPQRDFELQLRKISGEPANMQRHGQENYQGLHKEIFMVLSGKVVSKWGLCFGPRPVGYLVVLSSSRTITSSPVTNTSVWEGTLLFAWANLSWCRKFQEFALLLIWSSHSTAPASHVSLRPRNARSQRSLLWPEAPSCRNEIFSLWDHSFKGCRMTLGTSPPPLASWWPRSSKTSLALLKGTEMLRDTESWSHYPENIPGGCASLRWPVGSPTSIQASSQSSQDALKGSKGWQGKMSVVGGIEIAQNKWKKNNCQNIYRLPDNLTRVGRINLQIVSPSLLTSPCKKINDELKRGASGRVSLGESSQEFYYKPVPH